MRILTILFLSLFIFSACSDDDNSPTNPGSTLTKQYAMSLNIGDSRTYKITRYENGGQVGSDMSTLIIQKQRNYDLDGSSVKLSMHSLPPKERGYFENNEIYHYYSFDLTNTSTQFQPEALFKKYMKLDDTIYSLKNSDGKIYKYSKVIGIDIPLTIGEHKYMCAQLKTFATNATEPIRELLIADKFGIVRQINKKYNETLKKHETVLDIKLTDHSIK